MTDLVFIRESMKQDTNALGFIPDSSLATRIVRPGLYLIAKDEHRRPIGYLLHGPCTPGKPLYVYQVLIDLDKRRIRHATELLRRLLSRATLAQSSEIRLRCALELEANLFWKASGFHLQQITPGGLKRHRQIAHYTLDLQKTPWQIPDTLPLFANLPTSN